MKININDIYEGWKNKLIPSEDLKEIIEETRKERLEICNKCPEHSSNKVGYKSIRFDAHCTNCGCTLSAKTSCLHCECPLKYWKAKLSAEQHKEIIQDERAK